MDFMLEPLELGTDLDKLLDLTGPGGIVITCDKGYTCAKGTVGVQNTPAD